MERRDLNHVVGVKTAVGVIIDIQDALHEATRPRECFMSVLRGEEDSTEALDDLLTIFELYEQQIVEKAFKKQIAILEDPAAVARVEAIHRAKRNNPEAP